MTSSTSSKTQWPVVFVSALGGIVAALYVGKVPPALGLIRNDLDLDLVQSGYVMSVFNALGMILAMLVGTVIDRFNRKVLIISSFVLLSISGVIGSFADSFTLLLISRVFEGSGFISIGVAMPAVVVAVSAPQDRSLAISLWSIFTPTGMAIGLVTFPFLAEGLGWRGAWQIYAILPLLAALAAWLTFKKVSLPAKPSGNSIEIILQTLKVKGLWAIALSFGGFVLQWVSLMVWLPTFLIADMGFEKNMAALMTALIIGINIPSNIAGGWLLRQGVPARVLISLSCFCLGMSILGIFVLPLDDTTRIVCCFVFSLIGGLVPACLFAYIPTYSPSLSHLGASSGMLMQGSSTGQFVGPPLLAYVVSLSGGSWGNAVYPMLGGTLLTLLAGLYVTRKN
ncbi:MAG: MFS transporter [Methylocystaceae bacterium]|nr:MFS transporter [Methylocystaceae bacterium]